MTNPDTCPSRSAWQQIVGDDFMDFALEDLKDHLNGCPDCQATVESLMNGEQTSLSIAAELRQELPPAPGICQRVLEDLTGKASAVASHEEAAEGSYEVGPSEIEAHKAPAIQEYVQHLEMKARQELDRKPYHRRKFPVDLVAGLILIACGIWVLINTFSGEGGMMSSLINGILPALLLMMLGAVCILFWAK